MGTLLRAGGEEGWGGVPNGLGCFPGYAGRQGPLGVFPYQGGGFGEQDMCHEDSPLREQRLMGRVAILEWQHADLMTQASALTQNAIGPVEPVTPRMYWSCKILTGPTFFFFNITRKNCIKFTTTFISSYFIFIFFQKHLGTFSEGNILRRMSSNVYWPCRTSWGHFLLARSRFWEFLLAWGHRFTISVEPCDMHRKRRELMEVRPQVIGEVARACLC